MGIPKPGTDERHGFEGPLAEFAALRDEIQERVRAQQQLMSLQLTGSAAVFGFALTQSGKAILLLIVPISSYLLCGRLVAQHFGTLRVAKYITEELSEQVPGGLRWEQWLRREPTTPHFFGSTLPLLLTFVGTGALSLAWTARNVWVETAGSAPRLGLGVLWLLGLTATVLSTVLVFQMTGRLPVRGWEQTGLS